MKINIKPLDPESKAGKLLGTAKDSLGTLGKNVGQKTVSAAGWVMEDLAKIGNWEYDLELCATNDLARLKARLNEKGADHWECFSVLQSADGLLLFLKRPIRSAIKEIKDLAR
jgi:hypothetical protein